MKSNFLTYISVKNICSEYGLYSKVLLLYDEHFENFILKIFKRHSTNEKHIYFF